MGIVAFVVCLVLLIVTMIKSRKKLVSPSFLFYALWTFILFLSNLGLYNITKPSEEAYFLVLLMVVFFFIGDCITNIYVTKREKKLELSREKKKNTKLVKEEKKEKKWCAYIKPKYTLIYILIALFIIFTIIDCVIVIQNLIDGVPMWQIRRWRMGTFGVDINPMLSRRTFVEEAFRSIILTPFETLIPPITAYCFFNPEKYKKKYLLLILSLVCLLLSSLAGGGGRLGFIYYFGCFLLAFLVFLKKSEKTKFNIKKYQKIILAFFAFGLISVVLYTQIRTGSGNFIKQVYTYFALPPTLLSIWLPKLQEATPMYGLMTTFGVHSYFFRVFETLGLDFLVPQIYHEAFQHLLNAEIFLNVGYGVGNAFVTPIYYFFLDGGYFFVCFASMLFGIIVTKFYRNFVNNINIKTFVYYTLIMYGVFQTFIRIQTAIPSFMISFVMAWFLLSSYKKD